MKRHGWLKHIIKNLEYDPRLQARVHIVACWYWLINFPLICCLFFFLPTLWVKLGIFITLIYSIYANLATDYDGLSSAQASAHAQDAQEQLKRANDDA